MKATTKYWRTEMKPTLTLLTALLLAPLAVMHAAGRSANPHSATG